MTQVNFTATVTDAYRTGNFRSGHATSGTVSTTTATYTCWGTAVPPNAALVTNSSPLEIGLRFTVMQPGVITGIRWWRDPSNTDVSRTGNLWADDGTLLGQASFGAETNSTWNTATFASPVAISAIPAVYRFSVNTTSNYLMSASSSGEGGLNGQDIVSWPLRVMGTFNVTPNANGVFSHTPGAFPNTGNDSRVYGIDVVFQTTQQANPPVGPSYYARWANSFPSSSSFFPIGVWEQDPVTAGALYKAVGINTIVDLAGWPPDTGQIAAAKTAGIYVMAGGQQGETAGPAFLVANPGIASAVPSHFMGDELDSTTPTPGTTVQAWSNKVRAIDSTRPFYLNFAFPGASLQKIPAGLTIPSLQQQFDAVDIVSCDFYALTDPFSTPKFPGIWGYGRSTDNMLNWVNNLKPVWGIVETGDPWFASDGNNGTYPTNTQIAQAVWMMLIHGARGIIYFDHQFEATTLGPIDFSMLVSGNFPTVAAAVSALNTQILSLAPALNAPAIAGGVTVASSNTTQAPPADIYAYGVLYIPWGRGAGVQIDTTVRQPGDGYTYVFAIAGNPGTTTGTFTLSGSLGITGTTATVIGESRTVAISGLTFTDNFTSDYQYHLYQIQS